MAVCEFGDEGKRRRLPPWMLGIEASNRVTECYSSNDVREKSNDIEAAASISNASNSVKKRAGKKKRTMERENSVADSQIAVKCEMKRRKNNVDEDADNECGGGFGGQKQKNRKILAKRKNIMKSRNSDDSCDENYEIQIGEMDLTVEDCMAIALEYVEANMDQEKRNREERGSKETHLSMNLVSVAPGTDFDAADTGKILPTYGVETPCNSAASLITNVTPFSGTGDSAQDMLDLLLGPLLKKPKEVEK